MTGTGPYVIAPGGAIPAFGRDVAELPRVVLAYSGQRTFLIATSPVALVDLAKELRTQPGAFGADAFERAVTGTKRRDFLVASSSRQLRLLESHGCAASPRRGGAHLVAVS